MRNEWRDAPDYVFRLLHPHPLARCVPSWLVVHDSNLLFSQCVPPLSHYGAAAALSETLYKFYLKSHPCVHSLTNPSIAWQSQPCRLH
jgi:hypothetical protein